MNVYQENRKLFWDITRKNKKNKQGQTVITRDDESFYEDFWEEDYKAFK